MNRKDIIEQFFNEVTSNLHDIKCETLVNQALQKQLHAEDIVVLQDGRFVREYRPDVYHVNSIEDNWLHQLLQLHISRNGLYDLIPEGLFHQPFHERKATNSAADMAAHSRNDRKKEMAARKFFQPIENSIFSQRVRVEAEEENLLAGIDSGLLNDYFFRFWEFPKGLNTTSAMLLVLLLPYAYAITSDLSLMQDCLEILLQEKVVITPVRSNESAAHTNADKLGIGELGNDLVCGHTFMEDYTCLEYTIGPLQNTQPAEYCAGGENDLLLQVFNSYFAPAEADIFINVEVDRNKVLAALHADESPILGYAAI